MNKANYIRVSTTQNAGKLYIQNAEFLIIAIKIFVNMNFAKNFITSC